MFVSIYYKPSLFNAHTMILIVHIFMNVNKLYLNQIYWTFPLFCARLVFLFIIFICSYIDRELHLRYSINLALFVS